MNHLIEYWSMYVALAAVLAIAVFSIYTFIKRPNGEQMKKVREWLLWAVVQAEAELGNGTGQLKLRFVYDLFIVRFVWMSRIISYEVFTFLVDEALEEMREMLATNQAVQALVVGDNHG